jgi:TP901 family phage tail tape measure protein
MAGFNLTAQLNLQGPTNVRNIVSDIQRQIGTIKGKIDFTLNPSTARNVSQLNSALQALNTTFTNTNRSASSAANAISQFNSAVAGINVRSLSNNLTTAANSTQKLVSQQNRASKSAKESATQMQEFGKQSLLAVKRFAAFSTVTGVIVSLGGAIRKGVSDFISFDKQLVKLQQVTGESQSGLKNLSSTIGTLAQSLGVSSSELIEVSSTLAQAGLSARDTEKALKALALSSLAPSFDDMNQTVEGSIALMRQFGIQANDLEKALGSINAVSAAFAAEASDLIAAIQRTGGVFASASKGVSEGTDALNEFIAVFTSVRATTRESAETIATGLRTIFTRIQRGSTIDALKEYGVSLTDVEGKFVGAYKAVELLSRGLNQLDPRDIRFSKIVEELGGFRQIGKVIPLIQQFATAQQALSIAQQGQTSLTEDAAIAQLSLANQASKVKEEFLTLFREIGSSDTFQTLAKGALQLSSALISIASSVKGVLPVLAVMGAVRGSQALFEFGSGFSRALTGRNNRNSTRNLATGGYVAGTGDTDSVPAMLTPGEFVVNKKAVQSFGVNKLRSINSYRRGGTVWSGLPLQGTTVTAPSATGSTRTYGYEFSHLDVAQSPQLRKQNKTEGRGMSFLAIMLPRTMNQVLSAGSTLLDSNTKDLLQGYIMSMGYTTPNTLAIPKQDLITEISTQTPAELFSAQLRLKMPNRFGGPPTASTKAALSTIPDLLASSQLDSAYTDFTSSAPARITFRKGTATNINDTKTLGSLKQAILAAAGGLPNWIKSDQDLSKLGDSLGLAASNLAPELLQIRDIAAGTGRYRPKWNLEDMSQRKEEKFVSGQDTSYSYDYARGGVVKFMDGSSGGVKQKQEPFGTGETKFPRRITNAYAKQVIKQQQEAEWKTLASNVPTDERIVIDDQAVASRMSEPFDRAAFLTSFKGKVKRDSLFKSMGDFAKFIGLPQEDLSVALPMQIDFGNSGSIGRKVIGGGLFNDSPLGSRGSEGWDLSAFGYTDKDKQDLFGYEKLVEEKKKLQDKILKTPVETFDDGSFSYDREAFVSVFDEIKTLQKKISDIKGKERRAIEAAVESKKQTMSATGRGSISLGTAWEKPGQDVLYHELTHQLFSGLRARSAESFAKYKERVDLLFNTDNDGLADAFDALSSGNSGGYTSADVVYGRKYKQSLLESAQIQNIRLRDNPEKRNPELEKELASYIKASDSAKKAREYRPINPGVNQTLLSAGFEQAHIARTEDNGKEEFLTTLVQKAPVLDSNLQSVLDSTLTELLGSAGIKRQQYKDGGAVQRFAEGGQPDDVRTIKTRKQLQQYLYGKKSESPDTLVGSNVRIAGRLRRQAMKPGNYNSITNFAPMGDEGESIELDPSGSGKVIDDYLYYSSGGAVQNFMSGGVAQRRVGYIDYDVIANPANEVAVAKGMASTGVKGPRLYADKLTELAVSARKSASIDKLRAIYGVAGSGKTTLARGQGTDDAKLRKTERFPILTPEDIQRANEILILSSSVSNKKMDEFFGDVDRAYTLSSTTKAERDNVRSQRLSRDATGIGLEGRTPGVTSSVASDTAVGEALLGDRLGDRSVVLGRTQSGRLRQKKGDELVETIKKKIGFTWGGFSPMTAGHESIMDAAAAMGIPPEDFIYLVGANEAIKAGDPSTYRTAIFDQDARVMLAKAGAGAKGATILPKPRDFEVPQAFDISPETGRRKVLLPGKGSTTFVADKTQEQTAKYKDAGYKVANIERTEGISGTMVRDLIAKGDLGSLKNVLSSGVYDLVSKNIGRIQNRANVLPSLIEQVEKTQGVELDDIAKQIKAVGISRIDKKKMGDPEYAAKVSVLEELRDRRDKIKSTASFTPYKLLEDLARSQPDKYGLQFVDGGWVKRMKQQDKEKLKKDLEAIRSAMVFAGDTGAYVPSYKTNKSGSYSPKEEVSSQELKERYQEMLKFVTGKELKPLQRTSDFDEQELLDAVTYYQGGSGPLTRAMINKDFLFIDREEEYFTDDLVNRLSAAAQYQAPKKLYSGLGRGQFNEILTDTKIKPETLTKNPSKTASRLAGKTVDFPTFLSTSTNALVAESFIGKPGALMSIDASKSKQKVIDVLQAKQTTSTGSPQSRRLPGIDKIDRSKLASYDAEDEVVLNPNTRFKIKSAKLRLPANDDDEFDSAEDYYASMVGAYTADKTTSKTKTKGADLKQIKLDIAAQMLKNGGVARFVDGSPGGVSPILDKIAELVKQKNQTEQEVIISEFEAIGGSVLKSALGLGKAYQLPRVPDLRAGIGLNRVKPLINRYLAKKGIESAAKEEKLSSTRKVAIAGLFPLDYNKDFLDWKLDDGRPIVGMVRGFSSLFMEEVQTMQNRTMAARDEFARNIQDKQALGLLAGSDYVSGPIQPLAIDFDKTLALGTDMLGADGREDLSAYYDIDKVRESLARAQPTSLARRLAGVEQQNPGLVRRYTRILTARPQSSDDLIADTLNRFGLPYLPTDITGLGQGPGTKIPKLKASNLQLFEKLIDDSEMNIAAARASGKSVFQYGEARPLTMVEAETMGQSMADASMLEGALAELIGGANNFAALQRNRAIDFENGLGRAAQYFGLPPNIETEIKRTLDGDAFSKAREEYSRYFKENPSKYMFGGVVSRLADGGTVPALVSNGEAYVPPKLAKKIGYSTLNRMNQADRNGMGRFSDGGISVFRGPGSGTSDSIPTTLPIGSFIIREKATKALGLNRGGGVSASPIRLFTGGTATQRVIALKTGLETKEQERDQLRQQISASSGSTKILLESKLRTIDSEIDGLVQAIDSTIKQYDGLSNRIRESNERQNKNSTMLSDAQQDLVAAIKKEYADFDTYDIGTQTQIIRDARSGILTDSSGRDKFESENKNINKIARSIVREDRQQQILRSQKQKKFGDINSVEDLNRSIITPSEDARLRSRDEQFFDYRARKENVSSEGFKYSLARQLGQAAYQTNEQYAGRRDEMVYELTGKQDTLANIGATIREAQAAGSDESAQTRLADAQSRLAMEAENIARSMMELNPTLNLSDVQQASSEIATLLSNGKLEEAQARMTSALGNVPQGAEAMDIAMRQVAKQLGIDADILRRQFGSGSGADTLRRQTFIASREGQRYGALAEFAPDLLERFSGTRLGGNLGNISDFLQGKGGRFSKAFQSIGGLSGVSLGIAAAPGLIKNFTGDPTTSQGAATAAGIQGAATTFGTGLQVAASSGPFAPFVAAGAAVAAFASAVKDSRNAFIEFEKNLRSERLQKTLESLNDSFDRLNKDAKNVNLQNQVQSGLLSVGAQAQSINDLSQNVPKSFWVNLLDSTFSSGSLASEGINSAQASSNRSQILERFGTSAYFQTTGFGQNPLAYTLGGGALDRVLGTRFTESANTAAEENRRMYNSMLIPDQAIQNARNFNEVGSNTRRFLESRFDSGANLSDILDAPAFEQFAKNLALSSVEVQKYILAIENSTSANKEAEKAAVIRRYAENEITQIAETASRRRNMETLDRDTRSFSVSFQRMSQNMQDIINVINSNLNRFNDGLDYTIGALSGDARIGQVSLRSLDIIRSPNAFSDNERRAGINNVSGMFGSDSAIVASMLSLGKDLETNIMKAIDKTIADNPQSSDTKIGLSIDRAVSDTISRLNLPPGIAQQLSREIGSAVDRLRSSGNNEKIDFESLKNEIPQLATLIGSTSSVFEAVNKTLENWQSSLNYLSQAMNRSADLQISASERLAQASDIAINSTIELQRALGGTVDAGLGNRLRDQRTARLAGGETSPTGLAARINRLTLIGQSQRANLNSEIESSVGQPQNLDSIIANQKALRQTNNELRQTQQALKNLAENSDAAANALSAIQEAQQKQQNRVAFIEKLVSSTPEEIEKFNSALIRLQRISAGQNISQTSDERRETLSVLSDITPLLGSSSEANNMRANVLESMLRDSGIGLSPQFQDILNALRDPKADPATEKAIIEYKKAIDVQRQANVELAKINSDLADQIAEASANAIKKALSDQVLNFQSKQLQDIADGLRSITTTTVNQPVARADGGIIYAAAGMGVPNFAPRGTDTVPAMLTPGEFVVNRSATQANLSLLQAINNGYNKGGRVSYYQQGGYVASGLNQDLRQRDNFKESVTDYPDIPAVVNAIPYYSWKDYGVYTKYDSTPTVLNPDNQNDNNTNIAAQTSSGNVVGGGYPSSFRAKNIEAGLYAGTIYDVYGSVKKPSLEQIAELPSQTIIDNINKNKVKLTDTENADNRVFYEEYVKRFNSIWNIFKDNKIEKNNDKLKIGRSEIANAVQISNIGHVIPKIINNKDGSFTFSNLQAPDTTSAYFGFYDQSMAGAAKSTLGDIGSAGFMNVVTRGGIFGTNLTATNDIRSGLLQKLGRSLSVIKDPPTPINIQNITDLYQRLYDTQQKLSKNKQSFGLTNKNKKIEAINQQLSALYNRLVFQQTLGMEGDADDSFDFSKFGEGNQLTVFSTPVQEWTNSIAGAQSDLEKLRDYLKENDENANYWDENKQPFTITKVGGNTKEFPWISGRKQLPDNIFNKATIDQNADKMFGVSGNQTSTNAFFKFKNYAYKAPYSLTHKSLAGAKLYDPNSKEFSDQALSNFDPVYLLRPVGGPVDLLSGIKSDNEKDLVAYTNQTGLNNSYIAKRIEDYVNNNRVFTDYFAAIESGDEKKYKDIASQIDKYASLSIGNNNDPFLSFLKPYKYEGNSRTAYSRSGGSISLPVSELLLSSIERSIADNKSKIDQKKNARFGQKDTESESAFKEDQYAALSWALLSVSNDLFGPGSQYELPQILGRNWFVPRIANNVNSIYDIPAEYIRSYMDKVSGVFGTKYGILNLNLNKWKNDPEKLSQILDAMQYIDGASKAFKQVGIGDTQDIGRVLDSSQKFYQEKNLVVGAEVKDSVKSYLKSLGLRTRLGSGSAGGLTADQQREVKADLAGSRLNTGEDSSVSDFDSSNTPKRWADVFSIGLNPYNQFRDRSIRKKIFDKFISTASSFTDSSGIPLLLGSTKQEFIEGLRSLKGWYGGVNNWQGIDYLYDKSVGEEDPAKGVKDYAQRYQELKASEDNDQYSQAKTSHVLVGGKEKFGELPTLDYYEKNKTDVQYRKQGGIIYASQGSLINFEPRGTDTVPAMLTPGEFVVNRTATQRHLPLLKAINDGVNGYSSGGIVYLQQGGITPGDNARFLSLAGLSNRTPAQEEEYRRLKRLRDQYAPERSAVRERNERMALMAIPPNKRTADQQARYDKLREKRDADRPDIATRNKNYRASQRYNAEAQRRTNERLANKYADEYNASGSDLSPEEWAARYKPGMTGQRLDAFLARASGSEYDYGNKMSDTEFASAQSSNRARVDAVVQQKAEAYTSSKPKPATDKPIFPPDSTDTRSSETGSEPSIPAPPAPASPPTPAPAPASPPTPAPVPEWARGGEDYDPFAEKPKPSPQDTAKNRAEEQQTTTTASTYSRPDAGNMMADLERSEREFQARQAERDAKKEQKRQSNKEMLAKRDQVVASRKAAEATKLANQKAKEERAAVVARQKEEENSWSNFIFGGINSAADVALTAGENIAGGVAATYNAAKSVPVLGQSLRVGESLGDAFVGAGQTVAGAGGAAIGLLGMGMSLNPESRAFFEQLAIEGGDIAGIGLTRMTASGSNIGQTLIDEPLGTSLYKDNIFAQQNQAIRDERTARAEELGVNQTLLATADMAQEVGFGGLAPFAALPGLGIATKPLGQAVSSVSRPIVRQVSSATKSVTQTTQKTFDAVKQAGQQAISNTGNVISKGAANVAEFLDLPTQARYDDIVKTLSPADRQFFDVVSGGPGMFTNRIDFRTVLKDLPEYRQYRVDSSITPTTNIMAPSSPAITPTTNVMTPGSPAFTGTSTIDTMGFSSVSLDEMISTLGPVNKPRVAAVEAATESVVRAGKDYKKSFIARGLAPEVWDTVTDDDITNVLSVTRNQGQRDKAIQNLIETKNKPYLEYQEMTRQGIDPFQAEIMSGYSSSTARPVVANKPSVNSAEVATSTTADVVPSAVAQTAKAMRRESEFFTSGTRYKELEDYYSNNLKNLPSPAGDSIPTGYKVRYSVKEGQMDTLMEALLKDEKLADSISYMKQYKFEADAIPAGADRRFLNFYTRLGDIDSAVELDNLMQQYGDFLVPGGAMGYGRKSEFLLPSGLGSSRFDLNTNNLLPDALELRDQKIAFLDRAANMIEKQNAVADWRSSFSPLMMRQIKNSKTLGIRGSTLYDLGAESERVFSNDFSKIDDLIGQYPDLFPNFRGMNPDLSAFGTPTNSALQAPNLNQSRPLNDFDVPDLTPPPDTIPASWDDFDFPPDPPDPITTPSVLTETKALSAAEASRTMPTGSSVSDIMARVRANSVSDAGNLLSSADQVVLAEDALKRLEFTSVDTPTFTSDANRQVRGTFTPVIKGSESIGLVSGRIKLGTAADAQTMAHEKLHAVSSMLGQLDNITGGNISPEVIQLMARKLDLKPASVKMMSENAGQRTMRYANSENASSSLLQDFIPKGVGVDSADFALEPALQGFLEEYKVAQALKFGEKTKKVGLGSLANKRNDLLEKLSKASPDVVARVRKQISETIPENKINDLFNSSALKTIQESDIYKPIKPSVFKSMKEAVGGYVKTVDPKKAVTALLGAGAVGTAMWFGRGRDQVNFKTQPPEDNTTQQETPNRQNPQSSSSNELTDIKNRAIKYAQSRFVDNVKSLGPNEAMNQFYRDSKQLGYEPSNWEFAAVLGDAGSDGGASLADKARPAIKQYWDNRKKQEQAETQQPQKASRGGLIYANNGAFIAASGLRRGTDTVPAMLTPGEFVVNREATADNMRLLHAINSGHYTHGGLVRYLSNGGVVQPKYLANGSQNPVNTINNQASNSGVLSNRVSQNTATAQQQAPVFDYNKLEQLFNRFEQSMERGANAMVDGGTIEHKLSGEVKTQYDQKSIQDIIGRSVGISGANTSAQVSQSQAKTNKNLFNSTDGAIDPQ